MILNDYEVCLKLRYPTPDADIQNNADDIRAAMAAFNEKNESKKISKLVAIDETSIVLVFSAEGLIEKKGVGRELSAFSRTLYNEYGWDKYTVKENTLFLVDYCVPKDKNSRVDATLEGSYYKELNIELLKTDVENPRIKTILEMYPGEPTQEQIRSALLMDVGTVEEGRSLTGSSNLRESIKANRGIINPIIVNHDTNSGVYTVIEGNTRLQLYKEFKNSGIEGKWDTIPSVVHENLTQEQINAIRLQAHLVGPRDWDAYAKAKYIEYLYRERCLTLDQIVEFCGGNKPLVLKYMEAYKDMEKYYRPIAPAFDKNRFSGFVEIQNQRKRSSLYENGFEMSDFAQWVVDEKFVPLNTVRQLERVLDDPDARRIFLMPNKGMKEALEEITKKTVPTIDLNKVPIEELCHELLKKLRMLPHPTFRDMKKGKLDDLKEALLDLGMEIEDLRIELESD